VTADSGPWRGSVLVVDDDMVSNVVSRLVLAHMLRRMGFEVLEADDVGPAIEMVAGSDFSIVFCDFSMPGGTGLDVLARLARGPGHPQRVGDRHRGCGQDRRRSLRLRRFLPHEAGEHPCAACLCRRGPVESVGEIMTSWRSVGRRTALAAGWALAAGMSVVGLNRPP
jgi:CheY-like chemotaxis protein